ncbi:MAG: hypothetical protein PWR00_1241 [Thermovirga sp.]|jgi:ABC-type glutathione transport system ATPase component|nr:hypothetical protein [Thermovirga sp.]
MNSSLLVHNLFILDEERQPLVRNVSFSVPPRSVFFLVGETGSGKSLIAQTIAGTLPERLTAKGKIFFEGRNILLLESRERQKLWGHSIFLIPQEPFVALNPLLSVFYQVREIFEHVRKMKKNQASEYTKHILSSLGIPYHASKEKPYKFSGGMAQRALLAMALASPAKIVILDEPTKGLDSSRKEDAILLIKEVLNNGKTVLCITHDLSLPLRIGGNIAILFRGKLVEKGNSRTVLEFPSHPYTRGLLNAMPEFGLKPIPEELLEKLERACF